MLGGPPAEGWMVKMREMSGDEKGWEDGMRRKKETDAACT